MGRQYVRYNNEWIEISTPFSSPMPRHDASIITLSGNVSGSSLGLADRKWSIKNVDNIPFQVTYNSTKYKLEPGQGMVVDSLNSVSSIGRASAEYWGKRYIPVKNQGSTFSEPNLITYNNNVYIACGVYVNGQMAISQDGFNWTPVDCKIGAGNAITGIAFGNGTWVVCGYNLTTTAVLVSTSTDNGNTWTARSSGYASGYSAYGVAYGNGVFCLIASNGTTHSNRTSADGITWSLRSTFLGVPSGVIYSSFGGFVVVLANSTTSYSSGDGITWSTITGSSSNIYGEMANSDTKTGVAISIAGSIGGFSYRTNGAWTAANSNVFGSDYQSFATGVAYGDGKWVLVGTGGVVAYSTNDGSSWTLPDQSQYYSRTTGVGPDAFVWYLNNEFWMKFGGSAAPWLVSNSSAKVLFTPAVTY